jgi:hypothetical protein
VYFLAKPFGGSSIAVMISSARRFLSICGVSPGRRWKSANAMLR